MLKDIFLDMLTKAINTYLAFDSESPTHLDKLQNKIIAIELLPFHFCMQWQLTRNGLVAQTDPNLQADSKISGTPVQLLSALLAQEQNRKQFFADDLTIEGDAALGQEMVKLFDSIDIDWTAFLARCIGDISAHKISRLIGNIGHQFKMAGENFSQNMDDYLHEEANYFPPEETLQDFFADVDELRMASDRAEAKIKNLRNFIGEKIENMKNGDAL